MVQISKGFPWMVHIVKILADLTGTFYMQKDKAYLICFVKL